MSRIRTNFRHFISAVQFITVINPVRNGPFSPVDMIRFFPVVGLFIGAMLVIIDRLASLFFIAPVTALIDVVCLVVITGAFHLDGLGDTADGLFSHTSREKALLIMKDSRTGMMGLVAVICTLAVKFAGLWSIKITCSASTAMLLFLIVPAYARGAMIFGIRYLAYGRDQGTGHPFFERALTFRDFMWLSLPVVLSLFTGIRFVVVNAVFAAVLAAVLLFYRRKIGQITGDMLGAMTEFIEAVLFLSAGAGVYL